ncbi:hypothetical protein HPB50_022608 [Hyalomma asiaticum]|uniref:Uncharacterized protein n=1 Tax=Hyalomma asiaticum TaxID=266040 RepID=A0ACB7TT14_HYAAI|nr:hypothetical protein HPB50_022608 [Hyalomma asiaticum]
MCTAGCAPAATHGPSFSEDISGARGERGKVRARRRRVPPCGDREPRGCGLPRCRQPKFERRLEQLARARGPGAAYYVDRSPPTAAARLRFPITAHVAGSLFDVYAAREERSNGRSSTVAAVLRCGRSRRSDCREKLAPLRVEHGINRLSSTCASAGDRFAASERMARKGVAAAVGKRQMSTVRTNLMTRPTSAEDQKPRPTSGGQSTRRRAGTTARKARGGGRNAARSRQPAQPDMENALKRNLEEDEDTLWEYAPAPKVTMFLNVANQSGGIRRECAGRWRKTGPDPPAFFGYDLKLECGCTGACYCVSETIRFLEEPALEIEVETEVQEEEPPASDVYSFRLCNTCRAVLCKGLSAKEETCCVALLELRYGPIARDWSIPRPGCVQHGGHVAPANKQRLRSRARPNAGPVSRAPSDTPVIALIPSGARGADKGKLLKLDGGPNFSRRAAAAVAGCHNYYAPNAAPNAAPSGQGYSLSGRSATAPRPRASAAAGAPDGPRSLGDCSSSAVVIHLTAGDKAGSVSSKKAAAAAPPGEPLRSSVQTRAVKKAGPSWA